MLRMSCPRAEYQLHLWLPIGIAFHFDNHGSGALLLRHEIHSTEVGMHPNSHSFLNELVPKSSRDHLLLS